jgi:hypothetical protein
LLSLTLSFFGGSPETLVPRSDVVGTLRETKEFGRRSRIAVDAHSAAREATRSMSAGECLLSDAAHRVMCVPHPRLVVKFSMAV